MGVQTRFVISPGYLLSPIPLGHVAGVAALIRDAGLTNDVAFRYLKTSGNGQENKFRFNKADALIQHCQQHRDLLSHSMFVEIASVSDSLREHLNFPVSKAQLTEWTITYGPQSESIGNDGEDVTMISNFSIEIFGYGSLNGEEKAGLLDWFVTEKRMI